LPISKPGQIEVAMSGNVDDPDPAERDEPSLCCFLAEKQSASLSAELALQALWFFKVFVPPLRVTQSA
jgi:hypothetical protein